MTKYNPALPYFYSNPTQYITNVDYWVITCNIPKEKFTYFEEQGISWIKEENLLLTLREYPDILKWYHQCRRALEYESKPIGWHISSYVASCINHIPSGFALEFPNLKVKSKDKFLEYVHNPPAEEVYRAIAILYRRLFFSDLARSLNTEGKRFYRYCFYVDSKQLVKSLQEVINELKKSNGFIISDLALKDKSITPELIYKILFEPQEPEQDYFEYPKIYYPTTYNNVIDICDPGHKHGSDSVV
jgi:hypothetical protein